MGRSTTEPRALADVKLVTFVSSTGDAPCQVECPPEATMAPALTRVSREYLQSGEPPVVTGDSMVH